ncbi:MAG: hypothetical protein IT461_00185 [Planctomycetes bacterium]|jgi:hypothetical protein|nr:hypothetical protein [Planctomycetota bacterium]
MDGEHTVTVRFEGEELSIELVSKAFQKLGLLLKGSARKVSEGRRDSIKWVLSDLSFGSVIVTAEPKLNRVTEYLREPLVARVRQVVDDYSAGRKHLITEAELLPLDDLAEMVNGELKGVVVSTEEKDAVLLPQQELPKEETDLPSTALGTVVGKAQTLTSRKHLMFTLFDVRTDNAVLCYPTEVQHDQLRDIWDKLIEVDGVVSRDPLSGSAKTIREITAIRAVEPISPKALLELVGMFRGKTKMSSAEAVRRVRDAES